MARRAVRASSATPTPRSPNGPGSTSCGWWRSRTGPSSGSRWAGTPPLSAELEALTTAHPLRERLWALWAVALTRSGRQADALEVLARVRTVLDEELGLEPSAELRDLQTAVLRQDPGLEWVAPADGPGGRRRLARPA